MVPVGYDQKQEDAARLRVRVTARVAAEWYGYVAMHSWPMGLCMKSTDIMNHAIASIENKAKKKKTGRFEPNTRHAC